LDNPYKEFWAAWKGGAKWNAVRVGWNFPGESAPYWDWDDATDSCQKLDFTLGVGYPRKLRASRVYTYWIAAERGTKSSSDYDLGAQKLSNDCNNVGLDPGSSCMGLNASRAGSGTEPLVGTSRRWRVPSCARWERERTPITYPNGRSPCPRIR
jgi:hypothetical protein